ncbi:pyruvate kinase [Kutzneria albida]|uniref:pyruvate kinase n=1 Tax=Kutzneria albida DSM 43870 TaxID=1449976 RepID=W5W9A9_9PSEU|nr:pyruvate kinase [Kutzneria albida]AHH97547.1 hypothetical protein KALB_4183 [Kutzneria albida DSM 43870]
MCSDTDKWVRLRSDLEALTVALADAEEQWSSWLAAVEPGQLGSARNLVHYWAIRQRDLRDLQLRLAALGLSSLGRSEPHVAATLYAVERAVYALSGMPWRSCRRAAAQPGEGSRWLTDRAADLLGPVAPGRRARVMVTLPSSAADDPDLARRLLARGMRLARINCAHDDADAWRRMTHNVREAARSASGDCRIVMDLAGPKLRTGPLAPGPKVVRLRPTRDLLGRVTAPARCWLTPAERRMAPPDPRMTSVPVPMAWLLARRDGETVTVRDTRGANRALVLARCGDGMIATVERTTYLATGTPLADSCTVGELPAVEQRLLLRAGDVLELTKDCAPAPVGPGQLRIGCTLPEAIEHAEVGQPVHIDDGKISGRVIARTPELLKVRITRAGPNGSRLAGGRGVNLPETRLPVSALSSKDLADLPTVLDLADVVELSFVRDATDVEQLFGELDRLGDDRVGVVLKIETKQAFERLPQVLLTAMRRPRVGVMIARGDLAVECGYERLAELQEEILWLCEAAHLPVIWATQVLEQLARRGRPSRAEISDAAMSERAECVMLNKGPYIEEAVSTLDNVLRRMSRHHYKKNALLQSLHSWRPDQ